jgi:hypothetical protein
MSEGKPKENASLPRRIVPDSSVVRRRVHCVTRFERRTQTMLRKLAFALVLVASAGIAPAIAAPPLPGVAATDTLLEPARYRGYYRYYDDDYYDRDYYDRDYYRSYRHNRYRHLYRRHSDRWRYWHRHHDHDDYRYSRRHRYNY